MAISRVPGFSLLSNLDRQGVDLQFTTDSNALVYMDFTNFRFGVNTTVPQQALEVNGNVLVANGHVLTSANLTYDLGDSTNWWRKIYVGDVVAANLSIGNVTISGNTTSGIIYAEAVYDSNHRVLTTNTTFTLSGDVTGTGMYSNIAVTINNSGVAAGIYGDNGQIPQIAVNSKGLVTSLANIALTRISNIYVSNTTVYTASGNIILGPAAGYIFANNSIISNVANPINYQDVVTVNYLNSAITANRYAIQLDNSSITIRDDGTNPGWIVTQVDSNVTANITSLATEFYTKVNIGNLTFNNRTISSAGNILLDAQGTGIVQILGSDAFGLPYGGDGARPANPEVGYTRFNTDRTSIETWDGTSWEGPNEFTITSEVINPDGASNVYTLTSNATTVGVMVNINGTIQQPTTAYNIINNNQIQFTEIPLTTDIIEVRHIAAGAVTVSSLSYNPTELYLDSANVNVTGNILPTANTTYSLGSSSLQWKDLYVSGNSIYMGGTALTISNGVLLVGNAPVGSSSSYSNVNVAAYTQTMGFTNYSNVNVAAYLSTYSGNIAANISKAGYTWTFGTDGDLILPYGATLNDTANDAVAFGIGAGTTQGIAAIAIGRNAGAYQGAAAVAIGDASGGIYGPQGSFAVAVGQLAGGGHQGESATAIGVGSGYDTQGNSATAIGASAGYEIQGQSAVAIGVGAGYTTQGVSAVAVGELAGRNTQGNLAIAIGSQAALFFQLANAIAIGTTAGYETQGLSAIAIGASAGQTNQANNSIIINATGNILNQTTANTFTVAPIRTDSGNTAQALYYNTTTKEITYATSYSNVQVATYVTTNGLTNYSNVNVIAYTQTQSYTNYSNVNLSAYLGGAVTIGGNLTVNGNLFINGNLTTINANNLVISDSMIYLADDNPADTLDIGFVSAFTNAVRYQHTGFVRDATDGDWKLFANVVAEPTTTIDFTNASYSNLQVGNLRTIGTVNASGNVLASTGAFGTVTTSGNIAVSGNVVFSGWSIRETGTKLYFAYNGVNKMSLDTGGNLVVTGDVTAFGTIT